MSSGVAVPAVQFIVDALVEPVTLRHELAEVQAINRLNLPDDHDFTVEIGYRAVLVYDTDLLRWRISQVMPIPEGGL